MFLCFCLRNTFWHFSYLESDLSMGSGATLRKFSSLMIHDSTFLKELKYEKVKKSKKVEAVESGI